MSGVNEVYDPGTNTNVGTRLDDHKSVYATKGVFLSTISNNLLLLSDKTR